jgi:Zn-dependent protease with chaperone function
MTGTEPLQSSFFDGRQPRPQAVTLSLADGLLHIVGDGWQRQVPLQQVRWPERQRHGARIAYLPDGATLQHANGAEWDDWARAQGLQEAPVVAWMQSWRKALTAGVALVVCCVAIWLWGVPAISHAALQVIPQRMDEVVGARALQSFDEGLLQPSKLDLPAQAAIRERFNTAMAQAYAKGTAPAPAWQLHFRSAKTAALGPNAFALPGGHIVLTDDMAQLLKDRPEALVGVLAHELGHVRHRHGMQMVVQASLLSGLSAVVLGDVSGVLATVPAVLAQSAYSRQAEREADMDAARLLKAAGIAPSVMVDMFERISAERARLHLDDIPIALASHPANDERIAFFKNYR